ncbi:hypothetical protein [Actinophytocola xinjiangensis]|uniref:hypothetical protein n=1 Tax=Actinophytocola xinjiangensis TaxID=485602 RepID=UPI000B1F609E|nr:hypothetical protein [Actinophytocola xinjiangensis]
MADNDIDIRPEPALVESPYEAPVVFDFGPVFEVTRGSGSGNSDANGQEYS